MKSRKKEDATGDSRDPQVDTLSDLPVANQTARETKAGSPGRDEFDDIIVGTGVSGHVK